MRSYLLRNIDNYLNFIDRESKFWGIVVVMVAILFFGPICLNLFMRHGVSGLITMVVGFIAGATLGVLILCVLDASRENDFRRGK